MTTSSTSLRNGDPAVVTRRVGGFSEDEFHLLFHQYNQPIYNFFANRGFSREESRDLTQETFLEAHRCAEKFREESSPGTWIFAIAKNLWLRAIRDRGRAKRNAETVSLEIMAEAGRLPAAGSHASGIAEQPDPLENVLGEERAMLLRAAMGELPGKMRSCIFLYVVHERKCREIAEVLRISEGTVKFHLSQARERLRQRLAGHFTEVTF